MTEPGVDASLQQLVREEGRRVLATLTRITGNLPLAEDAVADAVVRALETWPRDGIPGNPRGWLTTTARNRAVDLIRREARRSEKEESYLRLHQLTVAREPATSESAVRDDLLRLVFTCCHPALALEAQVALSLRTLCGLTTAEVARALLVPEPTMTKRLTRAKQKIATARIPYRVPEAEDLPERVAGVVATVYLVFNEGYAATAGDALIRHSLCAEAIRLGRLLHELLPNNPAITGLLALMLLQDSRRAARTAPDGGVVLLADQDRTRWDRGWIAEGIRLLGQGLALTPNRPDAYVVQAAISACHALAPTWEQTDWAAIVSWYDVLLTVQDTPVVRLNRAAAVAEAAGAATGLAEMDAIPGLAGYPLWQASRAELLCRLGRTEEAVAAYEAACAAGLHGAQERHLRHRVTTAGP
ncbi:MAG: RNA polymerase sigma factor [Actinomycetes bacterium]